MKKGYNPDGREARALARAREANRCIRCGHPYECGQKREDKGEWSQCDEQCRHTVPVRLKAKGDLAWVQVTNENALALPVAAFIKWGGMVEAQWRILTVHHFEGDKRNDEWWNLMPLCQRCHLQIQGSVNPQQPWMFEHSDWIKPYVAGFYAKKYLGEQLTREQAEERLEELLKLERKA